MKLTPRLQLLLFATTNFLIFVERGILPGCVTDIEAFIQTALSITASSAQILFGVVASVFILGYSIGSVAFGQWARNHARPLRLVADGLFFWFGTLILGAAAQPFGKEHADPCNFYVLLTSRFLSGVGEAGFSCIIPPLISDSAPAGKRGVYMGALYMAIPAGVAAGNLYGAALAPSPAGWGGAFFFLALMTLPVSSTLRWSEPAPMFSGSESLLEGVTLPVSDPSIRSVIPEPAPSLAAGAAALLCTTDFLLVSMGRACMAAVFGVLATFGTSFGLGLGFFASQKAAAASMGAAVSLGGVLGTPLGGFVSDKLAKSKKFGVDGSDVVNLADVNELLISLTFSAALMAAAMAVGIATCWTTSLPLFLLGTTSCVTFAFSTQASTTLATLASSPTKELRAMAMSIGMVILHAAGDVPAAPVIGALAGHLAPACAGHGALLPACAAQRNGLRLTMTINFLWLLMASLFWGIGAARCWRVLKHSESAAHDEVKK